MIYFLILLTLSSNQELLLTMKIFARNIIKCLNTKKQKMYLINCKLKFNSRINNKIIKSTDLARSSRMLENNL